jgi:hypothetical protein
VKINYPIRPDGLVDIAGACVDCGVSHRPPAFVTLRGIIDKHIADNPPVRRINQEELEETR